MRRVLDLDEGVKCQAKRAQIASLLVRQGEVDLGGSVVGDDFLVRLVLPADEGAL